MPPSTTPPLPPPPREVDLIADYLASPVLDATTQHAASDLAKKLVQNIPAHGSLADELMQTYPLNSREGVALMSLAEAMLRVPDAETRDALLYDKIPGRDWSVDEGDGRMRLTGAAMAALGDSLATENAVLTAAVARLGMPVVAAGDALRDETLRQAIRAGGNN